MSYLKKLALLSMINIVTLPPIGAYSLTKNRLFSSLATLPVTNKNALASAIGASALLGGCWYVWSRNTQKHPFGIHNKNNVLNLQLKSIDQKHKAQLQLPEIPHPQKAILIVDDNKISNYLTSHLHDGCSADADMAFAYVHRGRNVLKNVLAGTYQAPLTAESDHDAIVSRHAYLQDIVGLCWQLFARAATKDQAFSNGTLVVHDDGTIYTMLLDYVKRVNPDDWARCATKSSNPYGYCRHSTHFKSAQHNGYHHYGIDVRFGDPIAWYEYWIPSSKRQQPLLPGAKKHILFGRLDEHRTFIKMEDDGLYLYDGWAQHAAGAVLSVGRKIGIGSNDHKDYRKEHMPISIAQHVQQIITDYNLSILIPKTIGEIIAASTQYVQFTPLATQLRTIYDHVEGRFGNEVILTKEELHSL